MNKYLHCNIECFYQLTFKSPANEATFSMFFLRSKGNDRKIEEKYQDIKRLS